MIDRAATLAAGRDFATTLAEQLLGRPVYVLFTSEDKNALAGIHQAAALTAPQLDLVNMPWLESVGRWRGRRPALAIDDARLLDQLRSSPSHQPAGPAQAIDHRLTLAALVAHELAHIFERGSIDLPEATHLAAAKAAFAVVNARAYYAAPPADLPPFAFHGPRFIRAMFHLRARAMWQHRLDFPLNASRYLPLESYGAANFWSALLPEMRAMRRRSIFKVMDKRMPAPFTELYQRDLGAWCNRQTQATPDTTRFVERAFFELETQQGETDVSRK